LDNNFELHKFEKIFWVDRLAGRGTISIW